MIKLISHIVLSAMMLLSATGLTISKHYCDNQLIDIGFITPADKCFEINACNNCHHDDEMENANHCDDETLKFEKTSDYFVSFYSFRFDNVLPTDLFFSSQILSEDQRTVKFTAYRLLNYKKPPVPNEVVLSQVQSFLF